MNQINKFPSGIFLPRKSPIQGILTPPLKRHCCKSNINQKPRFNYKVISVLLAVLFWTCDSMMLHAQSDLKFEHLSEKQGLPKTTINSILQDKEGFMWFGTEDGLYKYDGHKAIQYQADPANPKNTLQSNSIKDIHEDHKGRLWVVTDGIGLHQVDKLTGNSIAYPIDPDQRSGWSGFWSSDIVEDDKGILWFGASLGTASFNSATQQYSLYPSSDGKPIYSLKIDDQGILWATNDVGLYRIDPNTKIIKLFSGSAIFHSTQIDKKGNAWIGTWGDGLFYMNIQTPGQFNLYNPKGLIKDIILEIYDTDNLWLATNEGLQYIDLKTDQVTTYQSDPAQPGSLSSNHIWSIYKDRTENLWVGTSNGVNKASLRTKLFQTYQIVPTPSSFHRPENEIAAVLEDHMGSLWISSAAKGLYRLDPQTHQLNHIILNPNDKRTSLLYQDFPLLEDLQGQLWVGTDMEKGLYHLDRSTGNFIRYPCEFFVRKFDVDVLGNIWIAGFINDLASFDPNTEQFTYYKAESDSTGLIQGMINDLIVSRTGDVWVATKSGLSVLNPTSGKFTRYQPNPKATKLHLNDPNINTIYEDQEGIIWLGTFQGGLNRFDPNNHSFSHFTTLHGLPSNNVKSIIEDKNGNLWMSTSKGISQFNPETGTFRNYMDNDGFPGNEFYGTGSVYSSNGKIYFGNMDGLVSFYPDSIPEEISTSPIFITGFKVLENSRDVPTDKIELPYIENFLSFEFVAINYDAPEKDLYIYKLEGLDKDWIYSGTRRFASYTNLNPGEYTFQVKSSNNNGLWNEQMASIQFIILPPWWQTWWAYTLYALLALAAILSLRHYEMKRFKLRQRAEHLAELDTLKTRFFANISHEFLTPLTLILGNLQKLIARYSEDNQDKHIYQVMQRNAQRLLELINQLLDLSKLEAGSLKLETKAADIISFLKAIMLSFNSLADLRKIRYHLYYSNKIQFVYFDPDKLEKIFINLLSNAFKFTPEGGEISVRARLLSISNQVFIGNFKKSGSLSGKAILEIKVEDNGKGMDQKQLDRIFDRFYQVDNSKTREQEGTGIGLSLIKELVELYQGEISVESQLGRGSCFTVKIPLLLGDYEEEVGPGFEHNGQKTKPDLSFFDTKIDFYPDHTIDTLLKEAPMILIVEDNADLRYYIRETLQPFYHILEAADGKEGFNIAVDSIPDLILSDVMMPKLNGIDLCRKLKKKEMTAHIPIVLLTARASGEDKYEGLVTGADDYLTKPFEASELLIRIKNLIESRKKLREHFSREITLQPASIPITSVDEKFLQRAMQIIESHISDPSFGVEIFSREVAMSRMQLFRKLKALTNYSPGDFIRIMRLKRAAELLSHGAGNIAEVAFMVGYNEPSYFTKYFQKEFGKTPSEFISSNSLKN